MPERRKSSDPSGKAFEIRVMDAYRTLGYQVTHNVQLPGKQTDLIANREVEGAPPIALAIECKDHGDAVGNDDVLGFVHRVTAHRASNHISSGVMVSASGFTSDARAAALDHAYVTLLSWDELDSQILNVRPQLREFVDGYEASPIYSQYLHLAIEPLAWSTLARTRGETSLEDVLERWRGHGRPVLEAGDSLFVLADFGAGKTTLLDYIHYDRAKAYLSDEDTRVPLKVSLRDFRDTPDVTALLRASFRDHYHRDVSSELLWSRIESGRFYVLLDGFDEMVARSDARRRLDLFYALIGVLRSTSPTIITSRPSYFVERGEFDELLAALGAGESEILARSPENQAVPQLDRLRRAMVERHRETPVWNRADNTIDSRGVQVVRLLPLDREQIETFVSRRADELASVGATPEDLMAFIDRTYDLGDLASRPILLELIISSVVLGRLDLSDTETQYGASGLYELYTHAKLAHDLTKGRTRQGGLSLEVRRQLAERLAIAMYRDNVLEVDFDALVDEVLAEHGPLRDALARSGLTADEIATDFATCSFATLDEKGRARFVHKSFRGFFVARVLKNHLRSGHTLLAERLEREVLYFLGGFAPTQPGVGEQLWARFLHADAGADDVRRNLLVAHLYTTPQHDSRKIRGGEIRDAEFRRLAFTGSRMVDTNWLDCTVTQLELEDVDWRDVQLVDSHIGELDVRGGRVDTLFIGTRVESLRMARTTGQISLEHSPVDLWTLKGAHLQVTSHESYVRRLELEQAGFTLTASDPTTLEHVSAVGSDLRIPAATDLRADRSIVTCDGDQAGVLDWRISDCLVTLRGQSGPDAPRRDDGVLGRELPSDAGSVMLAPEGFAHPTLSGVRCGVFGSVQPASGRDVLPSAPTAWGVLRAGELLSHLSSLPASAAGCRHGDLLLVRSEWYDRQTASEGRLSAVGELVKLGSGPPAVLDPDTVARLAALLAVARRQFDALAGEDWRVLERLR